MSSQLDRLLKENELLPVSEGFIKKIAIIGGGTMGKGIAITIASHGLDVLLVEKNESLRKKALKELEELMDLEIQRWGMTISEKRAVLSRISSTVEINEVIGYDYVIEAIPERLEAKKNLFEVLDQICDPKTIFVTNTSSLSITELAGFTNRSDRFIGMHFLNPVYKTPVVEIVRGLHTSDETFNSVKELAYSLEKTPVEVFEYPGYITTRVILPLLNEAMHVVMEGVASVTGVDTAMRLGFNLPKGPLMMADEIGLDEVQSWMETLFRELGDLKYRPCPILKKMVRAGHLGKKTGQGFYKWDEFGRVINENREKK